MSRKPKSYCLDLESKKTESQFSVDNIKTQVINYGTQTVELFFSFFVSAFCLYYFYTTTNEKQLDQLTYITFLISCGNGLLATPLFSHESFCELKSLMDYAQEVLPLPFLTADLWIKFDLAPSYIAYMHAAFGLTAFFFLVIFEYKRPDLTDLAMILNFFSLIGAGIYMQNSFAVMASIEAGFFYIQYKRKQVCLEDHRYLFICSCAFFNMFALFSFDPDNWMPNIKEITGSS